MKKLLKFLHQLLVGDDIKVKINKKDGTMEISSNRELTKEEIVEILKKNL